MNKSRERAEEVIEVLAKSLPEMPPALNKAARYVINHPREVGVDSMRTLAANSSLHPNTFVRLARHIGFPSYYSMRETFRNFMVADDMGSFQNRAKWLQTLARKGGSASVLGKMAEAVIDNMEQGFRQQHVKRLESVCKSFLKADHVHVLGLGAAHSLSHQFWYVARMAFRHVSLVPQPGSNPIDDLSSISSRDFLMALTFQPYRTETLDAVRFAQRRKADIVGITDSNTSPLVSSADQCLICPTSTPQFFQSQAAASGLLDALLALLIAQAPEDARLRLHQFHLERQAAGMYEETLEHISSQPKSRRKSG